MNALHPKPKCPECGQYKQSETVSSIYIIYSCNNHSWIGGYAEQPIEKTNIEIINNPTSDDSFKNGYFKPLTNTDEYFKKR
jgi:ribosomal protein L37AE/L43A